jgi:hypothetical protein
MSERPERHHRYHATATAISGHLTLPLESDISRQAHAELPTKGGHLSQRMKEFCVEGVISFRAAATRVSGNKSDKPGQGWTTIATTVVECLNVMEIVTADRVVTQIITEHPLEGYVPRVNFLGTRFENLRIAGHPVEIDIDHNLLGEKPQNDGAYTHEPGVIQRIGSQYKRILESQGLPDDLRERYNRFSSELGKSEAVECSLVHRANGPYPGPSFGHIIHIPDFGKIVLAKLKVTHDDHHTPTKAPRVTNIHLTMVDLEMGCAASGNGSVGSGSANGGTTP